MGIRDTFSILLRNHISVASKVLTIPEQKRLNIVRDV